jgi:FRG domain
MTIAEHKIQSIPEYLETVKKVTAHWYRPTGLNPWFRGQSDASKAPRPSVFRKSMKEHDLTTFFIQRAGTFIEGRLPESGAQWLSLMQHVGLPTRLLDWTESALVGLYFALHPQESHEATVWLLDPIELNNLSGVVNLPSSNSEPVRQSYKLAFASEQPQNPPAFPIAVSPTQVHRRMAVQRGCFTIHGADTRSFAEQFKNHPFSSGRHLVKLLIPASHRPEMKKDLDLFGVKHTSLFPDLEGLATELRETFSS